MMNRRERLMATLNGEPVDRPPVSFYEINGFENMTNPDPFNIYSDPSWRPLIELARDRSDRIAMRGVPFRNAPPSPMADRVRTDVRIENGSRFVTTTLRAGKRVLTSRTRQDPDVNTVWTLEHLLKDADDFRAWLELPAEPVGGEPDPSSVLRTEEQLGDGGIVMIDTPDPLCCVAPLFDMGEFTVIAMTEPELFHRALQKVSQGLYWRTEAVARAVPGRLWRIFGPEYASPPYLPPALFREYVTGYVRPMVEAIQRHGGFARIHSHGRLREILDDIAATGCTGLDPIEPPPQGDVQLAEVRERVGRQMVLFGNLEVSDIENLSEAEFREKVARALREGTAGTGRGMVLMPSACPYGRKLSARSMRNYEIMVEMAGTF